MSNQHRTFGGDSPADYVASAANFAAKVTNYAFSDVELWEAIEDMKRTSGRVCRLIEARKNVG